MEKEKLKIEALELQPVKGTFLYRYMTIEKLLDFLFNERLPLLRLNIFEDRLEGASLKHLLLNLTSKKVAEDINPLLGTLLEGIVYNINPTNRNSLRRDREIFQKTNFANCWYSNNHESVAMWQLYSNPNSVAIRIPYEHFFDVLNNRKFELSSYDHLSLKFGSVHYYKFNDLDEISKAIVKYDIRGFLKDYSFSHEQEFRIMLEVKEFETKKTERKKFILDEQVDFMNNLKDLKILYFNLLNFKALPFELIFHPQSSGWHRQNIKSLLDKYGLPFQTKDSELKDIFS